jgi:hypothetical protein
MGVAGRFRPVKVLFASLSELFLLPAIPQDQSYQDFIYSTGFGVSGHTLKHLFAAAACFVILRHFPGPQADHWARDRPVLLQQGDWQFGLKCRTGPSNAANGLK